MKKFLALILSLLSVIFVAGCSMDSETVGLIEDIIDIAVDISDEVGSSDESLDELEEKSSKDLIPEPENKPENSSFGEISEGTQSKENSEDAAKIDSYEKGSTESAKNTASEKNNKNEKSELPYKAEIDKNGVYTSAEDVALYIHTFKKLPSNYITKSEARKLGWEGGGLEKYAPGKCIGGDRFGNYEGELPEKQGRSYTECDIDTLGKSSRGAKRIVFSNDGLIFYTEDHYESFIQLYDDKGSVNKK